VLAPLVRKEGILASINNNKAGRKPERESSDPTRKYKIDPFQNSIMISSILLPLIVVVVGMVAVPSTMAWAPVSVVPITHHQHYTSPRRTVASFAKKSSYQPVVLFSSNTDDKEDVVAEQQQEVSQQEQQRTTFDQAGASLIEEEDKKRMDQMGDFDTNDAVSAIYIC
jgi:hypothetical protein